MPQNWKCPRVVFSYPPRVRKVRGLRRPQGHLEVSSLEGASRSPQGFLDFWNSHTFLHSSSSEDTLRKPWGNLKGWMDVGFNVFNDDERELLQYNYQISCHRIKSNQWVNYLQMQEAREKLTNDFNVGPESFKLKNWRNIIVLAVVVVVVQFIWSTWTYIHLRCTKSQNTRHTT